MQINSNFISDASFYRPSESSATARSQARLRALEKGTDALAETRREPGGNNSAANPPINAETVALSSSKAVSAPHNASHINFYLSAENAVVSKRKQEALAIYRRNSISAFSVDGKSEFIGIDLTV